jgi:lysozyme family protein
MTNMKNFNKALKFMLKNEGANTVNTFGESNEVISKKHYCGFTEEVDTSFVKKYGVSNFIGCYSYNFIKELDYEQAKEIHLKLFNDNNYDKIKNQKVANKLFDTYILLDGNKKANMLIQEAFNSLVFGGIVLKTDGLIGKKTLDAINLLEEEEESEKLIAYFVSLLKNYLYENKLEKLITRAEKR